MQPLSRALKILFSHSFAIQLDLLWAPVAHAAHPSRPFFRASLVILARDINVDQTVHLDDFQEYHSRLNTLYYTCYRASATLLALSAVRADRTSRTPFTQHPVRVSTHSNNCSAAARLFPSTSCELDFSSQALCFLTLCEHESSRLPPQTKPRAPGIETASQPLSTTIILFVPSDKMTPTKRGRDPDSPEAKLTCKEFDAYLRYLRDEGMQGDRSLLCDSSGEPLRSDGQTTTGEIKSGVWVMLQNDHGALAKPVDRDNPYDLGIPGAHFVPLAGPMCDYPVQSTPTKTLQRPHSHSHSHIQTGTAVNEYSSQQTKSQVYPPPPISRGSYGQQIPSQAHHYQPTIADSFRNPYSQGIPSQRHPQPTIAEGSRRQQPGAVPGLSHNYGHESTKFSVRPGLLPPMSRPPQNDSFLQPHGSHAMMSMHPGYPVVNRMVLPSPAAKGSYNCNDSSQDPFSRPAGSAIHPTQHPNGIRQWTDATPIAHGRHMLQNFHSTIQPIVQQSSHNLFAEAGPQGPAIQNKRSSSPGLQAAPANKRSRVSPGLNELSIGPSAKLDVQLDLTSHLGDNTPRSLPVLDTHAAPNQGFDTLSFQGRPGKFSSLVPSPGEFQDREPDMTAQDADIQSFQYGQDQFNLNMASHFDPSWIPPQ